MKKFISILTLVLLLTYSFSWVFAATTTGTRDIATWASNSKVDHFELSTTPASTKIWEAIDLTVKAVDTSWNVKKDYAGTIYITVDNDTKATVPYSDWYQFTAADLWQKTFSKWLSFTKEGKMKVVVMDIENDSLEWNLEVTVWSATSNWWSEVSAANWDITITSPDNGMTISDNKVTVSWTSKKNSKVKYFLNWKELKDLESQTDEKWTFSTEIKDLTQSANVIQVKILDGNDKIIAASSNLSINIENSGPVFKWLTIKEWEQAPAWSEINIAMTADSGLSEANVTLGEDTQPLTESTKTPWSYEWKLTLPATAWDYSIDVSLKNNLWKATSKKSVATVKAIESNIFKNIKSVTGDKKVTFTFEVNPDKPEYTKFKFTYWTDQETLKTAWDTQNKESITFEKAKIKTQTGSAYSWYVSWLDPAAGKYYFQISPLDKDGKAIAWIQSDIVEVDFSLDAATNKCTISNVSWLKSIKNWDVSELTWDALPEATSYNVYKKWEDWQFTLIENVPINKYTLNIANDKVKYDDFAIKATCGQWEAKIESWEFSNVTKVQTWPGQIAILIWASLVIWFFLVRRKFAK